MYLMYPLRFAYRYQLCYKGCMLCIHWNDLPNHQDAESVTYLLSLLQFAYKVSGPHQERVYTLSHVWDWCQMIGSYNHSLLHSNATDVGPTYSQIHFTEFK